MVTIRGDIPAIINPAEAKAKANRLIALAARMEELLKETKNGMDQIDDQEAGILFGAARNSAPVIRQGLDDVSGQFYRINEQIPKTAQDIIAVANSMEQE